MQRIRPKLQVTTEAATAERRAGEGELWLSNRAYLRIAAGAAIVLFLLAWAILSADETGEGENSWLFAALFALIVFATAIAARKIVVRRARHRFILQQERLNFPPGKFNQEKNEKGKFTLEQHHAALQKIQTRSEAANSAHASAESHLEAFRACSDYLEQIEHELPLVHAGSPRLAAFRSGQERVRPLQKHHLLEWAAEESRDLIREAQLRATTREKVETSQRALEVLETALQFCPNEPQLLDSAFAVREFIASVRVAHWVELAERAAFKRQYKRAIDYYQDALFYLSREPVNEREREMATSKIETEINRLSEFLPGENDNQLTERRRSSP